MPGRIYELYQQEQYPEAMAELEARAPALAQLPPEPLSQVLGVGCELAFRTRRPELLESWGKRVMQLRLQLDQPEAALDFAELLCRYFTTLAGPLTPVLPFGRFLLSRGRASGLAPLLALALQSRSATLLREVLEALLTNRALRADERTLQLWAEVEKVPGYADVLSGPARAELERRRALFEAAAAGQLGTLARALELGADPDGQIPSGAPLLVASAGGHLSVVARLLQAGVAVDRPDGDGWTALHKAAQHGRTQVVAQLLREGAQVNRPGLYGQTALHLASDRGEAATVKALLAGGADVEARDSQGKTPLALGLAHEAVRAALLEAGAELGSLELADEPAQPLWLPDALGEYTVAGRTLVVTQFALSEFVMLEAEPHGPCYRLAELATLKNLLEQGQAVAEAAAVGTVSRVGELPSRGLRLRVYAGRRSEGPGLSMIFEPSDFVRSQQVNFPLNPESLPELVQLLEMSARLAKPPVGIFEPREGRLTGITRDQVLLDDEPIWLSPKAHFIGSLGEALHWSELDRGARVKVWPGFRIEVLPEPATAVPHELEAATQAFCVRGERADRWWWEGELARARAEYSAILADVARTGKVDSFLAAKCMLGTLLSELRLGNPEAAHRTWAEKGDDPLLHLGVKCMEMGQTSRHDQLVYQLISAGFHAGNPDREGAKAGVRQCLEMVLGNVRDRAWQRIVLSNWNCHLREIYEERIPDQDLDEWSEFCETLELTVVPRNEVVYPRPARWVIDWGESAEPTVNVGSKTRKAPAPRPAGGGWLTGLVERFTGKKKR